MKNKLVHFKNKSSRTALGGVSSGFTLIEVLVSLSLFTIVVTMAVGTLLVLIDANTKQQGAQSVVTNISFALDSMTREIRTGYFYYCANTNTFLDTDQADGSDVNDCAGGGDVLVITESGQSLTGGLGSGTSNRIAYRYSSTEKSIQRRLADTGVWQTITAPEVTINTLDFVVTGTNSLSDGDLRSPTVTIFLEGTAGEIAGLDTSFQMQTTVTQQVLDI
jgi:prepilin-type N-terminal cleavage/methylation domain-containing protein